MSGGSTNGVLHLLAIAREAGVPLELDEFDRISERTPLLCDLQPGGRYAAADLYEQAELLYEAAQQRLSAVEARIERLNEPQ